MVNFRKAKRALLFWLQRSFSLYLPYGLITFMIFLLLRAAARNRSYEKIQLVALPPYGTDDLNDLCTGLDLVRGKDALRFRRVQQFIKRVILCERKLLAAYNGVGGFCIMRKLVPPPTGESIVAYGYASLFVHEATHGRIDRFRIPFTQRNRTRIEQLCIQEQLR